MLVCQEPTTALFETPPGLIVAARNQWLAQQGGLAMLPPTDTVRDVQRCLVAMGVPHAVGLRGEEGLFYMRLALPDRWVGSMAWFSCVRAWFSGFFWLSIVLLEYCVAWLLEPSVPSPRPHLPVVAQQPRSPPEHPNPDPLRHQADRHRGAGPRRLLHQPPAPHPPAAAPGRDGDAHPAAGGAQLAGGDGAAL